MREKLLNLIVIVFLAFSAVFVFTNIQTEKEKTTAAVSEILEIDQAAKKREILKEKIGQMIMVGFRGTEINQNDDVSKMINDVGVGGIILFDYDVPEKKIERNITGPDQLKKLISDLQTTSKTPLFVSVDAEGGNVNRLNKKLGFLDISSAQGMCEKNTTQKESEKLAQELSDLGFNMNLAPVVDVNVNKNNPIIGKICRSFSENPKDVVENAEIFINSHREKNIVTVEKHFPGQGNAKIDTHLGLADITNTFTDKEMIPYKELNQKGLLDVVMTAHTINRKIDDRFPATMSKKFLQDILRREVGFDGVIMSDDMQMAAIVNNYSLSEAVIESIKAGIDIIVVSNNTSSGYDKDIAYKVRDIVMGAVDSGQIDEKIISSAYNRIIDLKKRFDIVKEKNGENFEENYN